MTTSDTVSGCTKAELANSKRISNESSLTQSNQFDSVLLLQKSRFIKSDLKFGSIKTKPNFLQKNKKINKKLGVVCRDELTFNSARFVSIRFGFVLLYYPSHLFLFFIILISTFLTDMVTLSEI